MQHTEVTIVGGGIAGASLAYEIALTRRVVLVEREAHPGYHSTGRSAAVFSETYGNSIVRALSVASRCFFESPPTGFSDYRLLSDRGVLLVARPDQQERAESAAAELHTAYPMIRLVDAAEARQIVPVLREDYVACGILKPNVMDIDVHSLLQGYLRGARARGAKIVTNAEVRAIARAGGSWEVSTPIGDWRSDILVNAAGAWADEVAQLADVESVGLVPKRRTAFIVSPPSHHDIARWPNSLDFDEQFYFKPEAGKILVSACDETDMPPCDVQADDMDIAECVERVQRAADLPVRRVERSWAGLRSFVTDRMPVVGFDHDQPNFFWLAGQGGYGIQTAPAIAQLAADLLMGRPESTRLQDLGVSASTVAPDRLRDAGKT